MSAKGRRARAWDDRVFPSWAWPVKATLRAFSSVTLAVILLSGISIYCILASIPVGLLAKIPTLLLIGAIALVMLAVCAGVPAWLAAKWTPGRSRAFRFSAQFAGALAGLGVAIALWAGVVWPLLAYNPSDGTGLRLFAGFIERYKDVTVRRLPGIEMTELEFYSAWPMRIMLVLFVINMIVATVRRIEFTFKNIGVLTVHTGIVTIALGSVYYQGLKLEGDTILLAGGVSERGHPGTGSAQRAFYDNTRVTLWVDQFKGAEQRPLSRVPRYNDYNLDAGAEASVLEGIRAPLEADDIPELSIRVPDSTLPAERRVVDPDLRFRIVGYAEYAEPLVDWVSADPIPSEPVNPMRMVFLHSGLPDAEGVISDKPVFYYALTPNQAVSRVSENDVLAVEYTLGRPDLAFMLETARTDLPQGYALAISFPGDTGSRVVPVRPGQLVDAGAGWTVRVDELLPEPPFPIITPGFENATSSIAILRVNPPPGSGIDAFDRWVYHRYPQLSQDLSAQVNERGMPARTAPRDDIRIALIDNTKMQVFIDEDPQTGTATAIVRGPQGAKVYRDLRAGDRFEAVEKIELSLGERYEHVRRVERPSPVPEIERDNSFVGSHDQAMLAVEVTSERLPEWSQTVWLPFVRFLGIEGMRDEGKRRINTPDGRVVDLAFGRLQRRFPGFQLRLVDFEMIAYDHRGAPRDYQSIVSVEPVPDPGASAGFEAYSHVTKLNAPLKAPFMWDTSKRSLVSNVSGNLVSHLDPNQFKLSQAGWDAEGWRQTQEMADQGLLDRPRASFTILGVGNNPGIHIIALGGILMAVGIPWAFYIKPWLVRRERDRLKAQVEAKAGAEPGEQPASPKVEAGALT